VNAGSAILDALAARQRVPQRVMVVAAHPDDETIGLGAQLHRFDDLLLVHVTDGAPRDGKDAANYGFASVADYAAARRLELDNALAAGGVSARRVHLDIADQEAHRDLAGLTRVIADLLRSERPAAVVTHAYEGGHPDHDAAAFAVHAACRWVGDPPNIVEMALYHRQDGRRVSRIFLQSSPRASPGRPFQLDKQDRERKQRMIDSFKTQRWLLVELGIDSERLRIAPDYDFRRPPHPGTLHYETLGWGITGKDWCRRAAAALAELGLAELPCL
jgi:N-acetylglucosamine malate deacetylase 2